MDIDLERLILSSILHSSGFARVVVLVFLRPLSRLDGIEPAAIIRRGIEICHLANADTLWFSYTFPKTYNRPRH
jgi:hypothetical protein